MLASLFKSYLLSFHRDISADKKKNSKIITPAPPKKPKPYALKIQKGAGDEELLPGATPAGYEAPGNGSSRGVSERPATPSTAPAALRTPISEHRDSRSRGRRLLLPTHPNCPAGAVPAAAAALACGWRAVSSPRSPARPFRSPAGLAAAGAALAEGHRRLEPVVYV